MPQRIQLSRAKGWRKPEGAIVVARPSRWGNPFRWTDVVGGRPLGRHEAVRLYRDYMRDRMQTSRGRAQLSLLAGHDLACWCPLDQPCHADVLLELANQEKTP